MEKDENESITRWHTFVIQVCMEKIKNGDSVIYKEQPGTIYGKPRESKYRGTLYTVKVGEEYYKASPAEITLPKIDDHKSFGMMR